MITRDDWLRALGEAEVVDDADALTIGDIRRQFRLGKDAARSKVQTLLKNGLAVEVTKRVKDATGRMYRMKAYRLVANKKRR